jgi:ATP-dependent RNA helicase RhlE
MTISFADLPIIDPLLRVLHREGYEYPTPIQAASIPILVEGRDLLGCAQTGTGKTAAFAIPIIQLLQAKGRKAVASEPRALVLVPTRELAVQVYESFETYGGPLKLKYTAIFGGVSQGKQVRAVEHGVHVLIATPGRLLDLMDQGHLRLDRLQFLVLDEADRMLDMGFLPAIKRIIKELPTVRQSIFLSATMPPPIEDLAKQLLTDPATVMIAPPSTTAQRVEQRVLFVAKDNKRRLLEHLLQEPELSKVLVFTRTKHGADRLAKQMKTAKLAIDAIHGNKSQAARQRVLGEFRSGKLRVLVATDVAARGIDVDGISHVVNFDIPNEPDSYVHRIGRTARAGESGLSYSFCDSEELVDLKAIEKEIQQKIPIKNDHPFHLEINVDDSRRGPKRANNRPAQPRPPHDRHPRRKKAGGRPQTSRTDSKAPASSTPSNTSSGEVSRKRSISGKVRKVKVNAGKKFGFSKFPNSSPPRKKKRRR